MWENTRLWTHYKIYLLSACIYNASVMEKATIYNVKMRRKREELSVPLASFSYAAPYFYTSINIICLHRTHHLNKVSINSQKDSFIIFNRCKLSLTTLKIRKILLSLNLFNKAAFETMLSTLTSSGGCMSSQASTWHCIIFQTQQNRKKREKRSKSMSCRLAGNLVSKYNTYWYSETLILQRRLKKYVI